MNRITVTLLFLVTLTASPASGEPIDLAKVHGIDAFPGDAQQRAALAREGFVVLPRSAKQMFSPYIGSPLPVYITVDAAHQTYHHVFEEVLERLERGHRDQAIALLEPLTKRLATAQPAAGLEGPHRVALGQVAVAARLLGIAVELPSETLSATVAKEVTLIEAAVAAAPSPLLGRRVNYALCRPRGFYAGDPKLRAFFRAVSWLGGPGLLVMDPEQCAAALIIVKALREHEELRRKTVAFGKTYDALLGPCDDLGPRDYLEATAKVLTELGKDSLDAELIRTEGARFQKAFAALRDPVINASLMPAGQREAWIRETKGLRLMPARLTPDGWLFQKLAEELPELPLPSGLHVAQALGSRHAREVLGQDPAVAATARHLEGFKERTSGHYGESLEAAALLADESSPLLGGKGPDGEGIAYQGPFARKAWRGRLLGSMLGSWASLRHAWTLHAKISVHFLGASQDPAGVVEPAPRYFAALASLAAQLKTHIEAAERDRKVDPRPAVKRLIALLEALKKGERPKSEDRPFLDQVGPGLEAYMRQSGLDPKATLGRLVTGLRTWQTAPDKADEAIAALIASLTADDLGKRLLSLIDLMKSLESLARKQMGGEALSAADKAVIVNFGKTAARIQGWDGNSYLSPQRQFGLIVPVAGNQAGELLEAAVGAPFSLYVVLTRDGVPTLYRGGVYSYYEARSPRPSTDAEWQARINRRDLPPRPAWTAAYIAPRSIKPVLDALAKGQVPGAIEELNDPAIGRALLALLDGSVEPAMSDPWQSDRLLAKVIEEIVRYGRGPLHDRIRDALIKVLQTAPPMVKSGRSSGTSEVDREVVHSLVAILEERDLEPLRAAITTLEDPPEHVAARTTRVLMAKVDGLPKLVEALCAHPAPALRKTAWAARAGQLSDTAQALEFLTALQSETAVEAQRHALERLRWSARRLGRSPRLSAALLAFHDAVEDPACRASIIRRLGRMGDAKAVGRLVELARSTDLPCLSALKDLVPAVKDGLGAPVREELEALLIATVRSKNRGQRIDAIGLLGTVGSAKSAPTLVAIAANTQERSYLRECALEALVGLGQEVALDPLLRMCFDETETGNSYNSVKVRICDMAARCVDQLLGGRFGWKRSLDRAGRDAVLVKMRDHARERRVSPKGDEDQ